MRIREDLIEELTEMGSCRAPQTVAVELAQMWERDCGPYERMHVNAFKRYLGLSCRPVAARAMREVADG